MTDFLLDVFFPTIAPMAMGVAAVVWRSELADVAFKWNYWLLGVKFDKRRYELGFALGGLGITVLTVLSLIGVIR